MAIWLVNYLRWGVIGLSNINFAGQVGSYMDDIINQKGQMSKAVQYRQLGRLNTWLSSSFREGMDADI